MELDLLLKHFDELKAKGLKIDATRGRPCKEQLDLAFPLFKILDENSEYISNGIDTRNYGAMDGIIEAKNLIGELAGVDSKNVIICGNSSLNIMYDLIAKSMLFGVDGNERWASQKSIKWLCPVPGYDRHFAILERMGIEMINIPLNSDGPDMDLVEEYLKDPSVKGIWCVPKFSNPSGVTYSDEVIKRLVNIIPAAKDFRIYWDNAYLVHDFDQDNPRQLLNIFDEASKHNTQDMIYEFVSFSKVSCSGGGIAAVIASDKNIEAIKKELSIQTIGFDKLNQLRHAKYFKNRDGIISQMRMHAKILKPKFDKIDEIFTENIKNIAVWNKPEGGYFILLEVNNCAKEVIERCAQCGVKLTPAGSSHPYHNDPNNSCIRIAPSCLKMEDIDAFCDVVCTAVKIETLTK